MERDGCCATWPKPCSYHEGYADAWAERQAVLDCINLYGDKVLHAALDDAGLFPRGQDDVQLRVDES